MKQIDRMIADKKRHDDEIVEAIENLTIIVSKLREEVDVLMRRDLQEKTNDL